METFPPSRQTVAALNLPIHAYYQLIHTLNGILPLPVDDTPEASLARIQAAMDKVAAMLPVNADEADLAAQCVAARAQAEDIMRLIRAHAGDTRTIIKLTAQYCSLVRASLGARGHLRHAQAVRHKRETSDAALKADEWTQYVVTRSLQQALDAGPVPAVPAAGPSALVPATPAAEPLAPAVEPSTPVPGPQVPIPEPAPAAQPPKPVLAASVPATSAEADEPPRNLLSEADRYALVYPRRAREIRHYGGLPPDCSFGPPDDDLVQAIVSGATPALRDLDGPDAAEGCS